MALLGAPACKAGTRAVTPPHPSAGVKPTASAPATPLRSLQAPTGKPRVLEGTVQLDAGYMVSVQVGRPLTDGFAVAEDRLLSNNGGNIISDNGAGLLSNNGGNIISDNGGGLTAKVKFGLLAAAQPALGLQLPIAGMAIAVVGLGDGQLLPLGVDATGKPAYVVYTDAKGHYKLYLPEGQARNVTVVAAVPDSADPRLAYGLVADPKAGGAQRFDEESALASNYVRSVVYQLFVGGTGAEGDLDTLDARLQVLPPTYRGLVKTGLEPFLASLRGVDLSKLSLPRRRRGLRRYADAVVARIDLGAIQTLPLLAVPSDPINHPVPALPAGPAIPALVAALQEIDQAAGARLAADPAYFAGKPYVVEANFHRAAVGLPPVAIRRPSDLGRFTSEEYEGATSGGRIHSAWAVLVDLGLSKSKDDLLHAIYQSIFVGIAQQMFADEALHDELSGLLAQVYADESDPKKLPEPVEPAAATPPFPIPVEAPVTVGTLVGTGKEGSVDGPAATAMVGKVTALALDPAGKLYFAQADGKLRVVALTDPAHPVSTLGGAAFTAPDALAFDPATGALYVGDSGRRSIFKLELPAKVTTVAGSLEGVAGLALDGHGGLVFTDPKAERVGRVELASGIVSTLVGARRPDGLTPGSAKAALPVPRGVVVTSSGDVLVLEQDGHRLWSVGQDGLPRLVAGWSEEATVGDGYYIGAGFRSPTGLALAPDGTVLVGDTAAERVRRVRLQLGGGYVTTVAGGGKIYEPGFVDGPGLTARMGAPGAIAVAADGTIYVADSEGARIRTIKY
ncbi:MAG: hypothetical protein JWM80_2145 [Cyanobacteria bacterium RYN_339]|nr:hypothetical protein [Cyanobacteria bacterium RYN_339]